MNGFDSVNWSFSMIMHVALVFLSNSFSRSKDAFVTPSSLFLSVVPKQVILNMEHDYAKGNLSHHTYLLSL